MKLVIFEDDTFANFYPLAYCRAVFELKCGWATLAEKIERQCPAAPVAYFCREWIEPTLKRRTDHPVNDVSFLKGDDLLIVNGRLICNDYRLPSCGPGTAATTADGALVYLWLDQADIPSDAQSLDDLLARASADKQTVDAPLADYVWEVMLQNVAGLHADFNAAGKHGVEGDVEQPHAVRGPADNVYIAPGASIHPFVCIDATEGPVYIDRDVEVHPFTRIEGPAYVGAKSILFGTKLREGCTIGPVCRVGGEVEETIIHGHSNKYHDGFLGHAYVGEWVNLGALTTNSDLKNDYSTVDVTLNGKKVDTGSTKVGAMIGDHTKTSIGTLFNTGTICGAMALIMATGQLLPKSIPSFAWFINGMVTKGFGKKVLYHTAKTAMGRRRIDWTDADQALWDAVFDITNDERMEAVKKGRRHLLT